jgi:hypothetical protein
MNNLEDKPISLYIDSPHWSPDLKVDDFIVAVGEKKSNSVYHIAKVNKKRRGRTKRFYVKVYKSDLITACRRDPEQSLIAMTWYKRKKKL